MPRQPQQHGECRLKAYGTDAEAVEVVLRSDDAIAYRCHECGMRHVAGGRYAKALNVPRLMAGGRFIAG